MVVKRSNAAPTDRVSMRTVTPVQAAAETSNLDRVIHERMRLGIVSALAASDSLSFAELKRILGTSDGNLSVHARKLEEVGYITCVKRFEGRIPRTDYKLTPTGKRALARYLDHMAALVTAMKQV